MRANSTNAGMDDDPWVIFLCVVAVMILVWILMPYYESYWYNVTLFEAKLAETYSFGDLQQRSQDVVRYLESVTPGGVESHIKNRIVNEYLPTLWHRWLLFLPLLYLSKKIYDKRSTYRGVPSLESLLKTEHRVWPTLEFVKRFNPLEQFDELKGEGRYQERPVVFAGNNKIIRNYLDAIKQPKEARVFDWDVADMVFIEQIGRPISSLSDLSPFAKAAIVLAVAKDLADSFNLPGKNKYSESAYSQLHRLYSIEFSKTHASRADMEMFLEAFTKPVIDHLDGRVWHSDIKKIVDRKDVLSFLKKKFPDQETFGVEHLKALPQFYGVDFENATSIKTDYPLIRALVEGVEKQFLENAFNYRLARKTTYEEFRMLPYRHAFERPLVVRAIWTAKRNGKFPPGRMVFFRPWDRGLFEAIQCTPSYTQRISDIDSMLTFSCEGLGIMSHFYHEALMKRSRVEQPYIDRAARGLHDKLVEQNFITKTERNI